MPIIRALLLGILFMTTNLEARPIVAYINAKIYDGHSFDKTNDAFLVSNGRFLKLLTSSEALAFTNGENSVVDLKGARILPGFIESHGHLLGLGKSQLMLDLRDKNPEQILELVIEQSKKQNPDTAIIGRGWDQNLWPNKNFPTKDLLSSLNNTHPVYLTRVDGHAIWVNQAVLDLASIKNNLLDPEGGQIIRDDQQKLTGVFIDSAMSLVTHTLKSPSKSQLEQYLNIAMSELARLGITSFHDAGVGQDTLELYEEYAKNNKLTVRLYPMLDAGDDDLVNKYLSSGPRKISDFLNIRSIKYFADGALGSRGAALIDNYHDSQHSRGLLLISKDDLIKKTKLALSKNLQVATHAIGDLANKLVLDAYEEALKIFPKKNPRLRIEHAQLIDPSDHHRFKKLDVIASMQPIHCTSDMAWVPDRLGPKRVPSRAYPWRSLLNAGAKLAFGSDTPVESPNPIAGIFAAVTRQDPQNLATDAFMPEQRLTLGEALDGYFSAAAFAEFSENQKGKIAKGFLADFVVFQEDILHLDKTKFLQAKPIMTVVGGQVVFKL